MQKSTPTTSLIFSQLDRTNLDNKEFITWPSGSRAGKIAYAGSSRRLAEAAIISTTWKAPTQQLSLRTPRSTT